MWYELQNPNSFFCLWIFSYSIKDIDILYWLYFINEKTILFPIEWSWCPWQKSIDHRCVGLFLGFTDLYLSLCQNYHCLFFNERKRSLLTQELGKTWAYMASLQKNKTFLEKGQEKREALWASRVANRRKVNIRGN